MGNCWVISLKLAKLCKYPALKRLVAAASSLNEGKHEGGKVALGYAGKLLPDSEFDRSRGLSSSMLRLSSLAPFEVEPGLCCKCKLPGTGEWVPSDMSESEVSEGVGEGAPSGRRLQPRPEF